MLLQIAKEEEKGVYLNFLNFLINDSIYLLDESLNKILELKELEAEMSNRVEWEQRPAQERQERTRLFHSQENVSIDPLNTLFKKKSPNLELNKMFWLFLDHSN